MATLVVGQVASLAGKGAEAQRCFVEALQIAAEIGFVPLLLTILISVAEFLVQVGHARLSQDILRVVREHPASE